MNIILQNLFKLQAIEFDSTSDKKSAAQAAELRTLIPPPIIGHYDRLRIRGKKGIAIVRNQVCTGCHMHVPIGQITMLMRGEDVQLCESCGRYLYLPQPAEAAEAVTAEPVKAPQKKAAAKPRKRRTLVPAA